MKTFKIPLLLIIALSLISACKKGSDSTPTSSITATYYFKGTLNGQLLTWQAANDGSQAYVTNGYTNSSVNQGIGTGSTTAVLLASGTFMPRLGIEFRTFQVNSNQNFTDYLNGFLNTGSWAYATDGKYTPGNKAVAVYYTDRTGKQYTSIGSQTGNIVNVIAVSPIATQPGGYQNFKIKLTFACTLYPVDGTGSTLSLTDAEATVML